MRSGSLLRERDFALVVASAGVSAAGDFLAIVALMQLVAGMSGSGFAVAGVALCLFAPAVALAGIAGLLVDRLDTVRLIVVTSLAQAAAAAALAFTTELAAVLALTAALGAGNAISQPAEFALVPAVAGEERLSAANGHVEAARYAGLIGGPLLAGVLVAAGGTRLALLVDAGTFVFVAAAVAALRARRRAAAAAPDGTPDRARDGFAHLRGDATLALVTGVATAALLLMSASIAADVFFAMDDLGGGAVYGLMYAAWGVGMVAGAAGLAPRVPAERLAFVALAAIVVQGLGKPIAAAAAVVPVALLGYAIGGVGHGARNVSVRTLIHARTPDRLRGRAFAAYNAMRNAAELAALGFGGALVTVLGGRGTLLVAGLGQAAVGLVGLAAHARRRARAAAAPGGRPAAGRYR